MSTTTAALPESASPAPSVISRGFAALLGVLAVAAAVGSGHLVAGVVSPGSSPYLAVGDTVIRFAPEWLTDFAKTTFGTADKSVLLAGMAVVMLVVAAAAGLASRRSHTPGVVVVGVLGVLGLLAVATAPTFALLDVLAPLASLGVGLTVFRRLHALALRTREAPDEPVTAGGVSRRTVLIGSSAAVGVASVGAAVGGQLLGRGAADSRQAVTARLAAARLAERAPAIPASAAFPQLGTPTFLTGNPDFYRIDVALRIPQQTAEQWSMRIHGMVDKEIVLRFDDLFARPLVERTITMTCVSNPVGGNLISTANFVGVDLRDILLEAGVRPGADQLFSTSVDGFTVGTPTSVVMEEGRGAMLAIGMNGEALPPEHGFPVRMVVPGLYGYVSATKWISDMEVTTFDAGQSYWVDRGWAVQGPIKTEARIDVPNGYATVPAGRVTVAGIAWSQPTGIGKVEVRMDGGAWQPAELATDVSGDTWRMWRTDFQLAPGSHTVQARATDAAGRTQTEASADVVPDGATGWPATIFSVA
ncbi:molybdopterin-dependent oxidoreductase [Pseudonocardia xinjiangensis]|uniref:molybdopterin-dependent oxidoreductase n=1 Tax=Pseudonocardia xinjiangensis TaxID=75289 RepID=UPI003D9130D6